MSGTSQSIWVITDGRPGTKNQALGLAEALGRLRSFAIQAHNLEAGPVFRAMPPKVQLGLRGRPEHYGLNPPLPDVAIGCGRQAIAPLLALKSRPGVRIIYIQDPRMDISAFDHIIAPEHDGLNGPNVIPIIGSPNRITGERIAAATLKFNDRLESLPAPRLAMLIGGTSKTRKLTQANHASHVSAARSALENHWSVMISTSRRTPDRVVNSYRDLAGNHDNVRLYDGRGDNPYFAFLGGADVILVTEESTNMLTDACTTGKVTFRLPMHGKPGKLQKLYDRLETRCRVRPYDVRVNPEPYKALKETDRAAGLLLDML
ncbi:MAG: mitochondrial fission ELM1 family protein [Hyphomonadaceae bacterium]|nr:mitochondrial fission ELM1 family protein [Hyphomonadaceae bacterium]